jgi:hypothetical protein
MVDKEEYFMMDHKKIIINQIKECVISGSSDFIELWDLPKYPISEQFGKFDKNYPSFNQKLLISEKSGHVQLENHLSPEFLYHPKNYNFRSGMSYSQKQQIFFFSNFVKKHVKNRKLKIVVDIGGNDGFVLKQLNFTKSRKYIIDPVAKDDAKSIKIINKFFTDIDLSNEMSAPDLIICRHTLEHVSNPLNFIEKILRESSDKGIFIFEVPSLEKMIYSQRFDTVMHQHISYFDINSLDFLISKAGGKIIDYCYYSEGSCGGSLIFAFIKGPKIIKKFSKSYLKEKKNIIKKRIGIFSKEMDNLNFIVSNIKQPLYGYGAGLMSANFIYHFKDKPKLRYILDDDRIKHNTTYKNLNYKVKCTNMIKIEKFANFLITALENKRAIFKRIIELKPDKILFPSIV